MVQPSHLKFIALPILFVAFAWLAGYFSDFVAAFRETDTSARRSLFRNISVFDSTSRLVNKADIEGSKADGAIQLFSHPYNDLRIEDNCWSTDEVEFELTSRELRVASAHDSGENFPERDRKFNKVSLLQVPMVVTDNFTPLRLSVGTTTWEYATKTQAALQRRLEPTTDTAAILKIEEERHALIAHALDPSDPTPFPNILCLHVVCLTRDNDFLALDRSKGLHFFGGTLSISFEEQMAIKDFQSQRNRAAEEWFRRAICEEIFPLRRYASEPDTVWPMISSHVKSMRIWSGILEETLPNFALLGVCKLGLSASELADVQNDLLLDPKNEFDNEGKHFYMTKSQVEGLVLSGHATARWLRKKNEPEVIVRSLHPTSMYRAATVLSCL